jgi:ADP-dependent NAD(P)H-hydrate dehydratase / NAD(P)H-hydrate epimerase
LNVWYARIAIQIHIQYDFPAVKILTAEEMREVDRLTSEGEGIPSATLMENAGASVARFIETRFQAYRQRKVVVLCGKGNNGGDGFVVARHLRDAGARPEVYLFAAPEQMQAEAAENCRRWQALGAPLRLVRSVAEWEKEKTNAITAEIIVDALLGTGVAGICADK